MKYKLPRSEVKEHINYIFKRLLDFKREGDPRVKDLTRQELREVAKRCTRRRFDADL